MLDEKGSSISGLTPIGWIFASAELIPEFNSGSVGAQADLAQYFQSGEGFGDHPGPKTEHGGPAVHSFHPLQLFRVGLGGSRNVLLGELAGLVAAGGVSGGIAGGPNWSDVAREYLLFSCLIQRNIGYPIVLGWFA